MTCGPLHGSVRACVIGDPVAHSRSPLVHRFWLSELGISGAYVSCHVRSEELRQFIGGLAANGYRGCNVTLPHKEAAFGLVDEPTALALSLEAVNTMWLDRYGRLHGDNTDVYGFLANLDQRAPGWRALTRQAVILGAGGSSRAVLAGLSSCNIERIAIVNRTSDRAAALAAGSARHIDVLGFDDLSDLLPSTDLLVNTTPLGMVGQPGHAFSLDRLKPQALVSDIVYVPLETPLLRAARLKGHRTVGGLGMLLHQAVPGFERWFGHRPQVSEALYHHVAADIAAGERQGASGPPR